MSMMAILMPGGTTGSNTPVIFAVQIAAFIAIFYFILIRPQRQQAKKHEALLKGVKRGDEIVTAGGIVGEVVHVKDDLVTVKSGEAKLVIARERIVKVTDRTAATPAE